MRRIGDEVEGELCRRLGDGLRSWEDGLGTLGGDGVLDLSKASEWTNGRGQKARAASKRCSTLMDDDYGSWR